MCRLISILVGLSCFYAVTAQTKLVLPYDAKSLTEEQKALNPDRLSYPTAMKEAVKENMNFQCIVPTLELGPFSVSPTRKVIFSAGNLQYNAAKGTHQCADGNTNQGTWRFAEHQWDYVGDAESGTVYESGAKCNNELISSAYDGWIDLFGWGTGNAPISSSESYDDYSSFTEWGDNAILYEMDEMKHWRTLSKDEWTYLFHERSNAEKLFGLGMVNGINGTIILPDDWSLPSGADFASGTDKGLIWKYGSSDNGYFYYNSKGDSYEHNTYTTQQWSIMEEAGAVFLPAAGYRSGTGLNYIGSEAFYWSSTQRGTKGAYYLLFLPYSLCPQSYCDFRYEGQSVRLVKDSK